uniref:Uncharacterized protein n=1 Tax=Panagrolaimus davidi TaxID=227884 RepID=A0A914QXX2_9BILA
MYSLQDLTQNERILLYIAEYFLIGLTLIVIVTTACLVISFLINPQFHVNMIMLISNLACLCIVYSICEITTAIKVLKCEDTDYCFHGDYLLSGSKTIIDGLKISSGICNVIAMPLIICERIIATVYFRNYEKQQHLYFVAFIVFIQWGASFLTVFLLFNGYIPFLLVAAPGTLISFIFIALFFYVDHLNHKMYHESISEGCAYTLSQRYQLCENIRTSNLLRKCSVVSSICIPVGIFVCFFRVSFTCDFKKMVYYVHRIQ